MWNQPQDPTPHLFSYQPRVTIHHDIFLKSLPCEFPHRIFHQLQIIHMQINGLLLSKFIQTRHAAGVSELKIISLYLVMVPLIASSSSSFVFIQFRRGIFKFFASSNKVVLFIYLQFYNPRQVTKILLDLLFFIPQKSHYHHDRSAYYIAGFLHQCIYTLQHMLEDDTFCLVFIQNQSLTQPLHCNACYMEHPDHENLSLCILSTFSIYH